MARTEFAVERMLAKLSSLALANGPTHVAAAWLDSEQADEREHLLNLEHLFSLTNDLQVERGLYVTLEADAKSGATESAQLSESKTAIWSQTDGQIVWITSQFVDEVVIRR
jgi:hypothetical protein